MRTGGASHVFMRAESGFADWKDGYVGHMGVVSLRREIKNVSCDKYISRLFSDILFQTAKYKRHVM